MVLVWVAHVEAEVFEEGEVRLGVGVEEGEGCAGGGHGLGTAAFADGESLLLLLLLLLGGFSGVVGGGLSAVLFLRRFVRRLLLLLLWLSVLVLVVVVGIQDSHPLRHRGDDETAGLIDDEIAPIRLDREGLVQRRIPAVVHITPAPDQADQLVSQLHDPGRVLLLEHPLREQAHVHGEHREPFEELLALPQRVLGEGEGGLLVQGGMRLEQLGDDLPPGARGLLLQRLDLRQRQLLRRAVVDRVAVVARVDPAIADAAAGLEVLPFAVGLAGALGDEGLGVQLGGGDDAEDVAILVGLVLDLKGQVEGPADDLVGGEGSIFP